MLTENQKSIISSITEEFLSFNEQRKVTSKPFNLFNASPIDASNEYSKEQMEEAKIVNKLVAQQLTDLLEADFHLLKQDVHKLPMQLSKWMNVEDGWEGCPKYERDSILGKIILGTQPSSHMIITYYAQGNRQTADNGETYVVLDGNYRLATEDYRGIIYASTLADLFSDGKFVERFTKFYAEYTK